MGSAGCGARFLACQAALTSELIASDGLRCATSIRGAGRWVGAAIKLTWRGDAPCEPLPPGGVEGFLGTQAALLAGDGGALCELLMLVEAVYSEPSVLSGAIVCWRLPDGRDAMWLPF